MILILSLLQSYGLLAIVISLVILIKYIKYKKNNKFITTNNFNKYTESKVSRRYNFLAQDFITFNINPNMKYDPESLYQVIIDNVDKNNKNLVVILVNNNSNYEMLSKQIDNFYVVLVRHNLLMSIAPTLMGKDLLIVDATNIIFYANKGVV